MNLNDIKILSSTILGGGRTKSINQDLDSNDIDYVIAQGTSADIGPYYVGSGGHYSKKVVLKKELEDLIIPSKDHGVPFIFSIGGAGADIHLNFALNLINNISREKKVDLKIGSISGEISKTYVKDRISKGEKFPRLVETSDLSEHLTLSDVAQSERIVAQIGPEPIIKMMNNKIDGIITGRALDTAIYMAPPLKFGFDKGLVAHMAKIIECGSQAIEIGRLGNVIANIKKDHFLIYPSTQEGRATISSLTRHLFYERMSPFREEGPGGYLDATDVKYEQYNERTVKASGGKWVETPYRIKIEGSKKVGYRTISIAGLRDPKRIMNIDRIVETVKKQTMNFFGDINPSQYTLQLRIYGKNGVLGVAEPEKEVISKELCIVIDVVAETQDIADSICHTAHYKLHHHSDPSIGLSSASGSIAFPFSPPVITTGPVYAWNVWHLMDLTDPSEPLGMEIIDFPR